MRSDGRELTRESPPVVFRDLNPLQTNSVFDGSDSPVLWVPRAEMTMTLPVLNAQPIEKQDLRADGALVLHSVFFTLQGEGPLAGSPAVFVRLAGCNLQCPLCDTDYSSVAIMPTHDVVELVLLEWGKRASYWEPLVVLTGGEPFRQNIEPLVHELLANGLAVQIETNGTLYVNLPWDHESLSVVCSPKAGRVNAELAPHIDAWKYVLHADDVAPDDGLPTRALQHTAAPRVARPEFPFSHDIYVQPVDVKDPAENARHLAAAVQSCLRFGYRLGVQLHKLAGLK